MMSIINFTPLLQKSNSKIKYVIIFLYMVPFTRHFNDIMIMYLNMHRKVIQ